MRYLIFGELFMAAVSWLSEPPPAWSDEPPVAWVAPAPAPRVVLPTDPSQPAPPGYQWQRWPGQPWKLYRVEEPQRPFVVPSGSTLTTPVTGAAGRSTSSSGSFPAVTFTGAGRAAMSGGTDCAPGG